MVAMFAHVPQTDWFQYLEEPAQRLVTVALVLAEEEQAETTSLADYTFVVFPMAKAYEGFLKQYFRDIGLISQEVYLSRRFRIGRALNPDVYNHHRDDDWLYDDVAQQCSPQLARLLWDTWLECRNRLFHYYPNKLQTLTKEQAIARLEQLMQAMHEAVACHRDQLNHRSK